MRLLVALLGSAILCCAHGTSHSQTFEPASFYYGQDGGNEIQKLDREYCLQHLGVSLFRKPSSFALIGEIFFTSPTVLRRFMLSTDEVWGRVVFGQMGHGLNTYGSLGSGPGEYLRATSIEIAPGLMIFVADHRNCKVDFLEWNASVVPHVLDPLDVITHTAAGDTLAYPIDIAWDDGGTQVPDPHDSIYDYLWVLSDYRNEIHKYKILRGATGPYHVYLYSYGGFSNDLDGFNSPWAIVKGRSNDDLTISGSYNNDMLYVADRGNERIVQLREQAGGGGLEWVRSVQPIDPALNPNYVSIEVDCWGNVYVVDMKNCQIVKLTSDLEYLTSYGTMGTGTKMGEFMYPKDFQIFFYWDQNGDEDHPRGQLIGTRKAVVLESWGDETGFQGLFLGAEVLDVSFALDEVQGTVAFNGILTDHCLLTATIERVVGQDREIVRTIFADSASASGSLSVEWDGEDDAGSRAACGDYYIVFQPFSLYNSDPFDSLEIPFTIPSTGPNVVSAWGSTVWEETPAEGFYCPSGDGGEIKIGISLKDCYGDPVVGIPAGDIVAVVSADPGVSAIAARGTNHYAQSASDSQGLASIRIPHVGGCGDLVVDVYADGIHIWQRTIAVRTPDLNGDGTVDTADFVEFSLKYGAHDPCADLDGNNEWNDDDVGIFGEHYIGNHFSIHPGYSSGTVTPSNPSCMVLCPKGDLNTFSILVAARNARNEVFAYSSIPADSIWAEIPPPGGGVFSLVCRDDPGKAIADGPTSDPENTTITLNSGGGSCWWYYEEPYWHDRWFMTVDIGGQQVGEWRGYPKSPDIDGSGVVNGTDCGLWSEDYYWCSLAHPPECREGYSKSDFDCNDTVDEADFDIMNPHYKHRCGASSQMLAEGQGDPTPWTTQDAEAIRSHLPNYVLDKLLTKELHPELRVLLAHVRSMDEPDSLAIIGGEVQSASMSMLPRVTSMAQSVPNPFSGTATISYQVAAPGGHVRILIFDAAGRRVRTLVDKDLPPGFYDVQWDGRTEGGRRVASGVYFYQMKAPGFTSNRRMMLVK